MEVFVRLAITKYYKTKQVSSQFEAIRKMFEESVLPYMKKFHCETWRTKTIWNEECDNVYKAYMPVIKMIYDQYSGRHSHPGTTPFMALDEFYDLIAALEVCNDSFGAREIGIHFNLSKQTEINELNSRKHLQMQFIEFIEATARIAEKVNIS